MAIVVIILDYSNNNINCHSVKFHPMLDTCSVSEATTEDVECLEAPMKRLLTILAPCKEFLEIWWMLILCHYNFLWLTSVARISNELFSVLDLKVESVLVPVIYGLIRFTAPKHRDVVG
jgi:hypothetical protein